MFITNHTEKARIWNYSGWLSRGQFIKTARSFNSAFDTPSFVPAAEGIPQSLQLDFQRILRTCHESALTIPTWVLSVIGDKHLEKSMSPDTSAFSLVCLEHCVTCPQLTRTCAERVHLYTGTEKDSESFYGQKVDNLQTGKNLPHLYFLLMRKRHQEATKIIAQGSKERGCDPIISQQSQFLHAGN